MKLVWTTLFFLVLLLVNGAPEAVHAKEPITSVLSEDVMESPVLSPTPIPTEVPSLTPTPQPKETPTATSTRTATMVPTPRMTATPGKKPDPHAPRITVIPNPARGTKVTFRVTCIAPVEVRLKVYNRFFDTVVELEGEGDHLFDILWSLKDVPEGPYSFQAQIVDKATGQFGTLPLQKFTVEKDETPPDN